MHQSVAALICHLSLTARQGHLDGNFSIDSQRLTPILAISGLMPTVNFCLKMTYQKLNELIKQGAAALKAPLLSINASGPNTRSDGVETNYFQRYWQLETEMLQGLKDLLAQTTPRPFDLELIDSQIQSLQSQKRLSA